MRGNIVRINGYIFVKKVICSFVLHVILTQFGCH